jgi:putative DNA primase/helicase
MDMHANITLPSPAENHNDIVGPEISPSSGESLVGCRQSDDRIHDIGDLLLNAQALDNSAVLQKAGEGYLRHGIQFLRLDYRVKGIEIKNWTNIRVAINDLPELFPAGQPHNIGIMTGAPSNGLLDIDLDCMEAVVIAPDFLPETRWIFGLAGKLNSHWLYRNAETSSCKTRKFFDVGEKPKMLVELRGDGAQTMAPPSVHPSGEQECFTSRDLGAVPDCDPSLVSYDELLNAARLVAIVALLARHWPQEGGRHDAYLPLC